MHSQALVLHVSLNDPLPDTELTLEPTNPALLGQGQRFAGLV